MRPWIPMLALGPLLLGAVGQTPESPPASPVTDRQMAMEAVSERMKELSQMARNPSSFDRQAARARTLEIVELLKTAESGFQADPKSDPTETWARPEIWQKPEDFAARFQAAHEKARALAEVDSAEALGSGLRALGQTCKSCHDSFRRPKA